MTPFTRTLRFWTALVMLCCMTTLDVLPAAAGLAPSARTGMTSIASARDADMLMAQRVLEHKVVAQKLRDYGVSADAAQLRLAGMSDQDLHQLASASKGLPSGGDSSVIGLLIVVILVIIILKLLNKEVIVR